MASAAIIRRDRRAACRRPSQVATMAQLGGWSQNAASSVVRRRDARFITVPVTSGFRSRADIRRSIVAARRTQAERKLLRRRTDDPGIIGVCVCVYVWSYRRESRRFRCVNAVIRFDGVRAGLTSHHKAAFTRP